MFPAFLITFREVIEASLIVATITGILYRLGQRQHLKILIRATLLALGISILLLVGGSVLGYNMHTVYSGRTEELAEGVMMTLSVFFITWAVFFLHVHFSGHREHLIKKVKDSVEKEEERGLFAFIFLAVFREGFEIVLFLSSIYLSSRPTDIVIGSLGGLLSGVLLSIILFKTSQKVSIRYAYHTSTVLLLLFGAGLLARGIHEFAEAGIVPELLKVSLVFIPNAGTFIGETLKTLFGITRHMDILQIAGYAIYLLVMSTYLRRTRKHHS